MGNKLENAKKLYLEGIRDGNARAAVTQYTGERYTQHSSGVRDGIEGFVEFFEPFIERNPIRDIQIIRGIEDGQYVFVQAYQSLNNGEAEWVTTDFFDTNQDDKIIEHWDVIAGYYNQTPSGHTSVDGVSEIVDIPKTKTNKSLVRDFVNEVLINNKQELMCDFVSEDTLIQHSNKAIDGYDSFKSLVTGDNKLIDYRELVLLVGQGNFVATLCKAKVKEDEVAQVDIFRIDKGLIVEHWENCEEIGPKESWNNSGKF